MQNHDDDMNFDFEHEPVGATGLAMEDKASAHTDTPKAAKTAPKPGTPGVMGFIKDNWLYGLLGLGLVVVVWYLFTHILFPSAPTARRAPVRVDAAHGEPGAHWVQAPVAATKPVVHATEAARAPASAAVQQPSVTLTQGDMEQLVQGFQGAVASQTNSEEKQTVQGLKQIDTDYQAQAQLLEQNQALEQKTLALLQQQVTSLNARVDQYSQELATVNQTLAATQTQLKLLVAARAEDVDQLKLRAVVPGRAWLVNADGYTVSVTDGSVLPHYGTVTHIDSDHGTVTTSSGYVFN